MASDGIFVKILKRSPSRELSPNRLDDVEEEIQEMEDEYDSIPAYEAPHKRDDDNGNHKKSRKRGVQYPDREFDRRWDRKKREAEEAKAGFQIVR